MFSRPIKTTLLVLMTFLLVGNVLAEIKDSDEVTRLYEQGRRYLRQGDFFGAARVFEQLSGQYPDSPNQDLFVFNRAKADYYLGDLNKAIAGLEFYLGQFLDRPEAAYAHFFLANALYRTGKSERALGEYVSALQQSRDQRLDKLAEASIKAALENASQIHISEKLFDGLDEPRRCRLITAVAETIARKGSLPAARRLIESCGGQLDPDLLSQETHRAERQGLRISFVLPFSGELQTWADDIYNGAVIAAEELRESGTVIDLGTHDSEGDPVEAARVIASLAEDDPPDAVVGPLTSEAAAVAGASLACTRLPLLFPAATQAGLTQMSSTAFQMSPNIELQGIRMAEYAVDSVGADTAAIITSTSVDHLRMARAFQQRFEKLGGTVLAVEYYRSRDNDFGPYVRDLKAMLLGANPDSTFFVTPDGDTLAQDGVSAFIDCLYMPGSSQQLKLLLPQIRFYKLMAAYLGSDGWGDDAVLRLGDDVTRNAVFTSPFIGAERSRAFLDFAAAYDTRYGGRPSRLAALGYDAVNLIAKAAENGRKPEQLTNGLTSIKDYEGAAGIVTFGEIRENTYMPLYQIRSDHPYPLDLDEMTPENTGETSGTTTAEP
ncbi:MAG TPA: penicillin-binding protein activator [candidate division Zixibacteria bacterium]|nr:penicillin-binding protein activator [candidate division Zixibacteria bacterium]